MREKIKWVLFALLVFLPIVLVSHIGQIESAYIDIIFNQIFNTVVVVVSVVAVTTIIGGVLAWVFAIYNFPFKSFLEIILVLGMVFPSYVLSFFYSETFNIFGQLALIGTLVVATLPYVFMIVTMSIRSQSQQLVDSALMLGKDNSWVKIKVVLPLIKPAIILSSLLVMGDTFSEFGATYFYGVDTVMTGIYEIWFGLHEAEQGIKFAAWTFLTIGGIYYFVNAWKRSLIGQQPTLSISGLSQTIQPEQTGRKGWLITMLVLLVISITFFVPLMVLVNWLIDSYITTNWFDVIVVTFNSTILATIIALMVLVFTTFILYLFKKRITLISSLSNTLYSTPGIVLAVAVVFVINATSTLLVPILFLYVLTIKYLAMGVDSIGVGIQKINRQYYYTAKTLGNESSWYIWNVQLPMSMQSYLIAGILVWIDVVRELVIGLTIRPQWLDLLSVEIYRFMDMELLYMSGPWIFAMVIITIIPIYWINVVIKK